MPTKSENLTVADLTPDPRNARRHPQRNLDLLEASLREVGAARSIVIDEDGTILAGNATVEVAGQIGIERVRVVEADGNELVAVRRRGLTPEQKTRLALFDNRVAELAEWDAQTLALLDEDTGVCLEGMFRADEIELVLREAESTADNLGESAWGLTRDRPQFVKVVIAVTDIQAVESAFALTGARTRGEAILVLAKAFVNEQR